MRRISTQRAYKLVTMLALAFSLLGFFTPARAQGTDESLCGNGSAPDYGLSYNLLQPHWTVGWEDYARVAARVAARERAVACGIG